MFKKERSSFTFNEKLNQPFLSELFEGDYEYAETVFGDFLKYLPEYSEEIDAAYSQRNIEELRKAVHKCKTLMGFVGLSDIQDQYLKMEKMCESGRNGQELDDAYNALKQQTVEGKELIINEHQRLKEYNGSK
jgi:chemotaxis protein histidine kinase CheA